MSQITLCENTFDPSTWETHNDVVDICDFLFKHFDGKWPSTAHIYLEHVSTRSDITPYDDAGIERLGKLQGNFFVVVYPEGIELILIIVALAVAAVAVGLSFLLRPHPATPTAPNQSSSANNQLSDRQNQARPNARIPDIFGQLWDTFDLLAVPYTTFINNVEFEHCYFCVGRGDYEFESIGGVLQIRDDTTPLSQISGATAQVYGPGTNPNMGSPSITVGLPFVEDVVNLQVFSGVNGQILKAPNINSWGPAAGTAANSLRFVSGGKIQNNVGTDWTLGFQAGDTLNIGGFTPNDDIAVDPGGVQPTVHLAGSYPILSVTTTDITLDNPALINPNWSALAAFSGGASTYGNDNMQANGTFWTASPNQFFIPHPDMTELWCNFICAQGCYKIDPTTGNQIAVNETVVVGWTPCDITGAATGIETTTGVSIFGSSFDRQAKGSTLKIPVLPGTGGILIRARRSSGTIVNANIVDEVQWRDCYVVTEICPTGILDFGDITTIQTLIRATPSALAVKNRKLNALITRKVPVPSGGSLAASTNAADIICAMALDPQIGNLQPSDVDIAGIYAIAGAGGTIQTYFSVVADPTKLTQFSYTFDDASISFEESLSDVAASIFCVAFRRGGKLSISFEKQTANSTLLFNHRNKVPKSESRTVTFGTSTANDGISLDYVEPNAPNYPNTDTTVTLYFPPGATAVNPKKVTAIGIRNVQQAMVLGWRLYWKLIAQNTAVQFDATEEVALSVLQDRILVADNTRSDTQDGDVIAQAVLLLTLSQNVVFTIGLTYSIFLQHPDETVENIPITAGPNPNQVILGHAPTLPCVFDPANYAKTTYMIVSSAFTSQNAFLLAEKTPKDGKIYEVKAVNYDARYYQHDLDTGVVVSAFGPCGRLTSFFFSWNDAHVRRVDPNGAINTPVLTSTDAVYLAQSGFKSLNGIVTDSLGNIYVADNLGAHVIYKIDPSNNVTCIAGNAGVGGGGFSGMGGLATAAHIKFASRTGLAIDSAGNIYAVCINPYTDSFGHLVNAFFIVAINRQSTTQTLFGQSIGAGCIQVIAGSPFSSGTTGSGVPATSALLGGLDSSVPILLVDGITIDRFGNLYVCDTGSTLIRKIDPSGTIVNVAGQAFTGVSADSGDGGNALAAQLNLPSGIVCDSAGNVYISQSQRIRVVNTQGVTITVLGRIIAAACIDTVAGLGPGVGGGFTADNVLATTSKLNNPFGIDLDVFGDLFIIDSANFRIRRVDGATGIITTVAGTGVFGSSGDGGPATAAKIYSPGIGRAIGFLK